MITKSITKTSLNSRTLYYWPPRERACWKTIWSDKQHFEKSSILTTFHEVTGSTKPDTVVYTCALYIRAPAEARDW